MARKPASSAPQGLNSLAFILPGHRVYPDVERQKGGNPERPGAKLSKRFARRVLALAQVGASRFLCGFTGGNLERHDENNYGTKKAINAHDLPEGMLVQVATRFDSCNIQCPGAALGVKQPAFRSMADALPHIVWVLQADGSPAYFNKMWLDYTGLSLEDSLAGGWAVHLHPEDSPRALSLWAQALASGEPLESDYRLRRADGVYRWMLARAVPQRNKAGRITRWLSTLTDIDDLKQATHQLEDHLALVRIAGKVAHLGGWKIELPERTLTWSDENCAIHDVPPGYKPTLAEGLSYFPAEYRANVIRHIEACAQHGTPYEFVLPKLTAKGRHIWVRSIGEAVRDASGKIIRIQGAFQDVTEQKEAEGRLLAVEAQLLTTLESITDGFFLMNKAWTVIFLNSQAERMLKRQREDLLGKNLWQAFSEVVGTVVEHQFRLAVEQRCMVNFEMFYESLGRWFDIRVYPTENGLAVYFQDVTQRRQAQAQLHLLETAVSRLNDIVVIMEAEVAGEAGPRVVFVNDAFERHTGYSRQDTLGRVANFIRGSQAAQANVDRIRAAMQNWQAVRADIAIHTTSGQELWLEVDVAPIANETGQFTHWVAVERDITERKQQQQEILRLNSELEERVVLRTSQLAEANKELESFAYSVSHDLRSPLNTIHGFSQLLKKSDGNNVSDKGKHYLERIGGGVKQMGDLIEGLLTLSHLSREQIKSEPVDLSAVARRIESDCREREPARQVKVFIQDGLKANGDPRLLSAVFHNLLSNAWKFTSRQTQAQIEVGSLQGEHGETIFFIRDNGAGFDMAFAQKLFGSFERLHSPEEFPGTGIGLATVKRVIERHGGRVWAEGKPHLGATFYFTFDRTTESVT